MELIERHDLELAVRAVDNGQVVIVPTSRWYMACCNAEDVGAADRIFVAKRRPREKVLLLEIPSRLRCSDYFHVGSVATRLIEEFWPGELALRLRWRRSSDGARYKGVGEDVALVASSVGLLAELAEGAKSLVAATSVNFSNPVRNDDQGPCVSPMEVLEFVESSGLECAYVIDGGICPQVTHLTIVDCSDPDAECIVEREGVVHRRAIASAIDPRYLDWRLSRVGYQLESRIASPTPPPR